MEINQRVIWTNPETGVERAGTLLGSAGYGYLNVRLDYPIKGEEYVLATRAELRLEESDD